MRMADLKAGWAVVGNDGHRVGTVQHADQDYLLVSRGAFSGHLYVPVSAIANVEHELVHLNLAKSEADQMGWEQPPREAGTPALRSTARPEPPQPAPAHVPEGAGITGVHAIVFTPAVAEVRAFLRDTLGLPHVDAGGGWLIFALPPAEVAVHPAGLPSQELYLLTDDLEATLTHLEGRGVAVQRPAREEAWGFVSEIVLPGGTTFGIYEPKHARPEGHSREPRR